MLSVLLRLVAFLLFILAGLNQTLLSQPPADLVAFGLAAWVLATLLGGIVVANGSVRYNRTQ